MAEKSTVKIRPKFLGSILLIIGLVLLVGFMYTVGLWLLVLPASFLLLFSNAKDVVGMFRVRYLHGLFLFALVVGFLALLWQGKAFAVSWFISAVLLSFSFSFVRKVLLALSVVFPFTNA